MPKHLGPRRRLEVEALEDRTLLAAGLYTTLKRGVLSVTGTDGSDTIVLRQTWSGVTLDAGNEHRLYVGVTRVEVSGRGGNDKIYVDTRPVAGTRTRPVDAKVDGGSGNDTIITGAGTDTVTGGSGGDTISNDAGTDRIDGGDGPDRLYGGAGNDTIVGGSGEDLVSGGKGSDSVDGGAGDDWAYGGEGTDTVLGGAGDDYAEGGAGNDRVSGGSGNDWVIGGAGTDQLFGDAGNDMLDGGPGADSFDGGRGFDQYRNQVDDLIAQFDRSDVRDVRQGEAGTCVLLASLLAVTNTGVDLAARIRQVGAHQYSVPLFRPGTGWVQQTVYFDGVWTDNDPMLAAPGEAWVLIYQRAYLQEMGVRWNDPHTDRWTRIYGDKYQRADSAFTALTGDATWTGNDGRLSADHLQFIARATAGRHPVIALTKGSGLDRYGLIEGHAYAVLGVRGNQVTLRNPWGYDGPIRQGADDGVITVSWDVFRAAMMGYAIA
jgi:RTX calcium-binding nonapeptide repeat (4 copies)/Calpain family cysteine protease